MENWPNRHITFIWLKFAVYFALFTVMWGRGLPENVRIPSYGGRGLKLLKSRHMIFERSPRQTSGDDAAEEWSTPVNWEDPAIKAKRRRKCVVPNILPDF